jgi:DNA-binding transcriptional LysR family regulator
MTQPSFPAGQRTSLQNTLAGITLRQLQYFVAVAEDEHFTHAAERLTIAQPSLSRQVSDLEEVLGVALFIRESRGVRLTEAGRELLERTRVMLNALEQTIHAVRFAGNAEVGRLRLGYYGPSFFSNSVTRTAFERFRAESPDVEVISLELFSEQLIRALREGRIDIGISRGLVRGNDIESRVIAVERAVVLVASTNPLANKPALALADLDGQPVISFPHEMSAGLNERIVELSRAAGITLHTVQEVTQLPSIGYHVAQNDGIAILPASPASWALPGVVVRDLVDPGATFDLTALIRKGEDSAVALRFMELLTS